ncbi:MAG TPA: hypothetical protein PLS67_04480 [Accumulibacter sp.]|jgi:hypothetical protein|nr:hypothetical protein [Accumulibacter sp.]HQC79762.1 hypothetical protein [Accumulibacter sp.]
MSNLVPGITFSLSSLSDFSSPSLASEIVRTICDVPSSIRPSKFGPFEGVSPLAGLDEPVKFISQPEKPVKAGSLVLTAGKNCEYQVQWNKSVPPSFPFVGGFLLRNAFDKKSDTLLAFLDLVKKLASTTNVVYGDVRSMEFAGWDTPVNLSLRLPDIPNVSIYGKPYIELFGRERIEGAPFHRIEQLSDDLYWLQATELVTDPVPEDLRVSIRKYFDEDAFMSGKKWRYSDGLHPAFDFSAVAE